MLRASSLAVKRKLELRVVPLPAGADPAEMIQRDGPEAMSAAVARSVAFVRFRVERVLAAGEDSTPEGRDRMIEQLRPVFATLAPSAMRMELTRMVSSRLALPESLAEQLLAPGGAPRAASGGGAGGARGASDGGERRANGGGARVAGLSGREETERAFLALCIASPEEGATALEGLDVDEHFSSQLLRRVARRLRAGDLSEPMAERSGQGEDVEGDPDLKRVLAELIVEAGAEQANPAMLEVQRLQLELASVDRQIQQARGRDGSDVSALARRRAEIKRDFDKAYGGVLEQTGDREG
jgi:DNA primase